jgi:glutamate-ammonia-ligase adenylyltransferase
MRLAQRVITAFTANSREGTLYPVDARLRPHGDKGPLASSVEAFAKYQSEDAWTWEHMALTRTCVVFGTGPLRHRIEEIISGTLGKKRDSTALVAAVADMRARMRREQKDGGLWDLKRHPGGLIDAEFILQYLLLRNPGVRPADLRPPALIAALKTTGALSAEDALTLENAIALWSRLQFMVRLLAEGELPDDGTPLGLKQKLAATAGIADFPALETRMRDQAARLSALFERMVAAPGAAALKALGPDAALR